MRIIEKDFVPLDIQLSIIECKYRKRATEEIQRILLSDFNKIYPIAQIQELINLRERPIKRRKELESFSNFTINWFELIR